MLDTSQDSIQNEKVPKWIIERYVKPTRDEKLQVELEKLEREHEIAMANFLEIDEDSEENRNATIKETLESKAAETIESKPPELSTQQKSVDAQTPVITLKT